MGINADTLVGKQIGDYQLVSKLTSGGMADIYLGEDINLGRRAAIKILIHDIDQEDDSLTVRFRREARAVAQLEHDNIIPIYQHGEADNMYFIAMRYIEGSNLAEELERLRNAGQSIEVGRLLNILGQIASALDYAHARGIIHRDIKPSNILLGDDDKAILTDFGLVLWGDVDATYGTAFGTPRYISPEQAKDSQSAVPQSDIYALAVILYEVLTGELLFGGQAPMEVALAHVTETPIPPKAHNPNIPSLVQVEILRALSKDYRKRHTTASEFIDAVKSAYDDANRRSQNDTIPLAGQVSTTESNPVIKTTWSMADTNSATKRDNAGQRAVMRPVIIGLSIVGLLVIGGLIALIVGEQANNNALSETPTLTILEGQAQVDLLYNSQSFLLINRSESMAVVIGDLHFESGNDNADFSNNDRLGQVLEPGACVRIQGASGDRISADCRQTREISIASGARKFWEAESADDREFSIFDGTQRLQQCATVGRLVERMDNVLCSMVWTRVTEP